MTDTNTDPVRLFEDPASGPVLRGDLSAAAEAKVTGLDVAAGLAGLGAVIATQAAGAGATAAASTGAVAPVAATGLSFAAKAVIVGGLVVASVGAWVGLSPKSDPAVDKVVAPAVTTHDAVAKVDEAPAATRRAPAAYEAPALAPTPAPVVVPDEAQSEPDEDAVEPAKPKVKRAPKKAGVPLSQEDAMAEAGLISRAKKALAAKPSEALRLTDQAKRGFPKGMLIEEREAIAIQALAKLGKHDAAAARGERFLARYGRGPHAKAVRRALDGPQ